MTGDMRGGSDRAVLVRQAMAVIERRGESITRGTLASEAGITRAQVERIFPAESDLFDAVAEAWFAPQVAIMEQVLATDLPPQRMMYEFFARRFIALRKNYRADPSAFATYCEIGAEDFERVRSYVDLADHYLCEIIAHAQAEGHFPDLEIDEALSLINQMVSPYVMADMLIRIGDRLNEQKLASIIDTIFAGLSGKDRGAAGVRKLGPAG